MMTKKAVIQIDTNIEYILNGLEHLHSYKYIVPLSFKNVYGNKIRIYIIRFVTIKVSDCQLLHGTIFPLIWLYFCLYLLFIK